VTFPVRPAPPLALAHGSGRDDVRRLLRSAWLLAALALLFAGMALQRAVPAAVGALVLVAGLGAMAWSRLSLERITYERRWSTQRAFVGEEIEVAFSLRNRKALPLPWFEVRELLPDQLPPVGARVLPAAYQGSFYYTHTTSLAWYERVTWRQRFSCTTRGFYEVGPVRLRSGDLFGFFPRQMQLDKRDPVAVLPRLLDLGPLELPVRRPFGSAKGGNRIFEDQSRIAGLRDYRPGDPLKRIDWKATARRGTLQSRLYDPSATVTLIVALNADTFAHTWEGYDPLLLERAVAVAGSIAAFAEAERYAVGLIANCSYPGADRPIVVPAGRDPGQITRVLDALAMVGSFTIATPEGLLERERRRFPLGVSIAMVAGYVGPPLAEQLERMQREGASLALYWVGDEPPRGLGSAIRVHDLAPVLRRFERDDKLCYGGDTANAGRLIRRAI
jgi:uncharacterized protein (DUF58 family)